MKKIIVMLMSLVVGGQALAAGQHGDRGHHGGGFHSGSSIGISHNYNHYGNGYNRGYNNYNRNNYYNHGYNYGSRGEWRHANHNGQLAWWFVVGSAFYLTEQAYLNESRAPVIVNQQPVYSTTYVTPNYVAYPQSTYNTYNTYRTSWYCENTGLFSTGSNDTCPTPWVSRTY